LKLARVDSRDRASRSHQVLKAVLLMDQGLDQVKMERKIFKIKFSRRLMSCL